MVKPRSASAPPTTLPSPSSVAQATELRKPAKSVSTPTDCISSRGFASDPHPHPLATRAQEEALPRVTAAMDALLQGKEIDRTAEEIFNEAFGTPEQPKTVAPVATPAKSLNRDQELIAAWEESGRLWPDYCRNVDARDIQLQGRAARDFGVITYSAAWDLKNRTLRRLLTDDLRNAHTRQGKTFAPLKGRRKRP